MLSKNLKQGSSINSSKCIGILNMLTGNGIMLAWYQDKPIGVLNMPASNGAISGKIDLVNAPPCTWFKKMIIYLRNRIYINTCVGQLFMMSLENGCK